MGKLGNENLQDATADGVHDISTSASVRSDPRFAFTVGCLSAPVFASILSWGEAL